MKTVTAVANAYIGTHSTVSPQDLSAGKRVTDLSFFDQRNDMSIMGYTLVGEAKITVSIPDEKALIDNKVQALREEAKSIRAEATAKVTQIEGQIQSLLAITCDAALVDERS